MGKSIFVKIFWLWLLCAAMVTVTCWLAYFLVQQDVRQSADYPQSQTAENISSASTSLSSDRIDISTSLAPFVSIFDAAGNLIESNAVLYGAVPVPPHGVFAYTKTYGEDRFTWEPQTGVRIAAVLVYHSNAAGGDAASSSGFFALSGRSLHDVEILESRLADDTFFAWVLALIAAGILSIFTARAFSPHISAENKKPVPAPARSAVIPPPQKTQPVPISPVPPPPLPVKKIPSAPPASPVSPIPLVSRASPILPPAPALKPISVPASVPVQPKPAPKPTSPPTPIPPPTPMPSVTPSIVLPTSPSDMTPVYYSRPNRPIRQNPPVNNPSINKITP